MVVGFVGVLTSMNTFRTTEKNTLGACASWLDEFLCSKALPECMVPLKVRGPQLVLRGKFCCYCYVFNYRALPQIMLALAEYRICIANFFS